jgi:hypothetical protein
VIGNDNDGLPAANLPTTVTGLFGTAATLYARRFPLYATIAVLAIGVQYIVDVLVLPGDSGLMIGLDIVIGAFLAATVSIGIAFDLAGKDADWSRIFTAASLRWGVVTFVMFVAELVYALFAPYLTLPGNQTGYGFLLLPFILIWAAVGMGSVVAAIEPVQSRLRLPLIALGKGMGISTRFVNIGRLMLYALLLLIPVYLETFAETYLTAHKIADAMFWSNVTVDMLTLGPLQALATVFYINFLRRAGR